jgi:predicted nuclease of predicted toxin-antitoxin system
MKLLLDQGLPRSAVFYLEKKRVSSVHAGDCGLATAADSTILSRAREENWTIVTLDADFHAQLVLSGARNPSLIRIRIEGLRGAEIADLIDEVLRACKTDLEEGSVTESGIRIRRIPLRKPPMSISKK